MLGYRQMCSCFLLSFLLLITFTLYNPPFASSDTNQYVYDELGRLVRVVNDTTVTNYAYDEVGNILSVTNGSLADTPSVVSVAPATLLVGVKTAVVFSGQNLLSVSGITSLNGKIQVNSIDVSPSQITAMLTATNVSGDTIKLTFRDYNQTVYQTDIAAVASTVVMNPPVVATLPNSTVTTSISLNPPLASPLTIGLKTDNVSIATVPSTITIPAGGSASLQITTKSLGFSGISDLNNEVLGYVVSENPIGANGATSLPISVSIEPSVTPVAPSLGSSSLVSVSVAPTSQPVAPSGGTSLPVSVSVAPTAQTIAPSSGISRPVSVSVAPTPAPINPSMTVSPQISITVSH